MPLWEPKETGFPTGQERTDGTRVASRIAFAHLHLPSPEAWIFPDQVIYLNSSIIPISPQDGDSFKRDALLPQRATAFMLIDTCMHTCILERDDLVRGVWHVSIHLGRSVEKCDLLKMHRANY